MPTIDKLNTTDSLSDNDFVPVFDNGARAARKAPLSMLAAFMDARQSNLVASVKEARFGAFGDGAANDAAAIQAAMDYVSAGGGGTVFVPPGRYAIGADLKPRSNVTLRGAGRTASILMVPNGNSTRNAIFRHVDASQTFRDFTLEDIGFQGQWQTYQSEVADNGLVTLKYVTGLKIRNCALRYSRAFALNINECDTVRIEGCLLEYACRDMIAVWGSPNVQAINNVLRHNDDDGISINWETAGGDPVRSQIVVTGNLLEDTGPIRTQAPKNVIISHNTVQRPKGTGIILGVVNVSTNNISSGHNILIAGNVISDVIERQWFTTGEQTGSVNNRIYIALNGIKPMAGALAVPPGEINPATGQTESPYDYFYKRGSIAAATGSIRAPDTVIVRGNICRRTLPAVAKYSDWGYGMAYGKNGMIDHAIPDGILRGMGLRVQLPYTSLRIEDNHLECGRYGIAFDVMPGVTLTDRLAKGVKVKGNTIRDFDSYGIVWLPTTLSHQDIIVEGNDFDGDPHFISSNRGANGTWLTQANGPTAMKIAYLNGFSMVRNHVRNVAFTIDQLGASGFQYAEGNIIHADAAAANFSTSNRGVGTIPGIGSGEQWWLQSEDCDPTSPTYGQMLGVNNRNSSGMPTSGKWLTGTFVRARAPGVVGTGGSQYAVLGWVRKATGSTHVLNTDWHEMRCLTGT